MSKLIDAQNRFKAVCEPQERSEELFETGKDFDHMIKASLESGLPVEQIAALLCNRVGELVRLSKEENKTELKKFLYSVIDRKTMNK